MDDVRLPDLEVIRKFSIAVRREHAPVEEVIAALRADLAELTRPGRVKPKRDFEPIEEAEDIVESDDDDEPEEQEEEEESGMPPLFERGSSRRLKPSVTKTPVRKPVFKTTAGRKPARKKPAARKPALKKKPARRR